MAFVSPDYAASDAPFRLAYAPLEHFTRDNVLHDLTGTIADFEAHNVAQTLLVRQIE
jgi:hypothetical protein